MTSTPTSSVGGCYWTFEWHLAVHVDLSDIGCMSLEWLLAVLVDLSDICAYLCMCAT